MKQLLYGPARRQRLGAAGDASAAQMEQEQESALLSELAEGDFSADQNIVEVCGCRMLSFKSKGSVEGLSRGRSLYFCCVVFAEVFPKYLAVRYRRFMSSSSGVRCHGVASMSASRNSCAVTVGLVR